MGSVRTTAKNLPVVRVDAERNLLLVRGSVPGSKGTTLLIRRSKGEAAPAPAEAHES
jgi:large subunit ribosomal protein L3